jgi:hypothetical protein
MSLKPEQIAEALLDLCHGRRDVAAEIAELRSRETFAMLPDASNIWRKVYEVISSPAQVPQ